MNETLSRTDPVDPGALRRGAEVKVESHLLTASGVLAIWLVAIVSGMQFGFWPQLAIFIVFTGVFVSLANGDRLGLGNRVEVAGIVALFSLSALSWFMTPTDVILILTVVMMAEAPYILSRRRCWQLMLLTNVCYLAVSHFYWNDDAVFLSWVSMFALQAFATTSSLARVKEAQLKHQLFEQNAELMEARSALAQKSQMEERLRIAGDLHDSIGHQLTALRLQLEALSQVVPLELKTSVAASQQLSQDLLENIRAIVKRMSGGDVKELGSLIQQIDSDTPGVNITLQGEIPELAHELKLQLIPCIKEGVSNAIRHSGADTINLRFGESRLYIEDNGKGISSGSSLGFGLTNLKQRLAPFGGEIQLDNLEPNGCRLTISLASGFHGIGTGS